MKLTQATIDILNPWADTLRTPEDCGRALARIDRQCLMPAYSRYEVLRECVSEFFSDCEMSAEELCKVFAAYEVAGGAKLCAWLREQERDND